MADLVHIGIHDRRNQNAGDSVLFELVRTAVDRVGPHRWHLRQLWDPLDRDAVASLTEGMQGIVLGGGGLLLRDQTGADAATSGWQWPITLDAVRAIDVPLIVFAVGYNRFRGQADFDPPFAEHLTEVVQRSSFFGLRNTGSIQRVREYLPRELHGRVRLQPCPTTCLWQLVPSQADAVRARNDERARVLVLNVAFDREQLRFADRDAVLSGVARAMKHAEVAGWSIRVAAHKDLDTQITAYLDAADVRHEVRMLASAGVAEILDCYTDCDLAVGSRGHAQMIPFGLRRPILSIITHDKLQWFLDDIGHPEWGVEGDAPDLAERLVARIADMTESTEEATAAVTSAQERMWSLSQDNLRLLAAILGPTP